MTYTRAMLGHWFAGDERMIRAMEKQQTNVENTVSGLQTTAQATDRIEAASVIVLAGNNAFTNERVLKLDPSLTGTDDGSNLTIKTSAIVPRISGGFNVNLVASGNSQFLVPLTGTLATTANTETFLNKTLASPKITGLADYADDTEAAAGGVPVNGLYRTASALKIRVV